MSDDNQKQKAETLRQVIRQEVRMAVRDSMADEDNPLMKEVRVLSKLMTGNGSPETGVIVQLAKLKEKVAVIWIAIVGVFGVAGTALVKLWVG